MDIRQNLATGLKLPVQLNSLPAGVGFGKNKSGEDDGGRQDAGKAAFYIVLLRTDLQEADSDPAGPAAVKARSWPAARL